MFWDRKKKLRHLILESLGVRAEIIKDLVAGRDLVLRQRRKMSLLLFTHLQGGNYTKLNLKNM